VLRVAIRGAASLAFVHAKTADALAFLQRLEFEVYGVRRRTPYGGAPHDQRSCVPPFTSAFHHHMFATVFWRGHTSASVLPS
jgi:hypothetical protein